MRQANYRVVKHLLRQSLQEPHQVNEAFVDAGNAVSLFILAHQQPDQFALALLAMCGTAFAMGSGEALAGGDSDRITRFGDFEIRGHDRSNQRT
jgi:hypothetical protein